MTKGTVDYEILYTPISLVDGIWPVVNVHIESALKHSAGEYSLEDILSLIKSEKMQLWCIGNGEKIIAAYTTQVRIYPQKKALLVVTLGGKGFFKWGRLMEQSLYKFAKQKHCSHLEILGRKGWARLLGRRADFKQQYVVLIKEIPHEDTH